MLNKKEILKFREEKNYRPSKACGNCAHAKSSSTAMGFIVGEKDCTQTGGATCSEFVCDDFREISST